jgi:hypothetical protein
MKTEDLAVLIASRLEDMADQVAQLHTQGYPEEAELLRREGLELAKAFDDEQTFLVLGDVTEVR